MRAGRSATVPRAFRRVPAPSGQPGSPAPRPPPTPAADREKKRIATPLPPHLRQGIRRARVRATSPDALRVQVHPPAPIVPLRDPILIPASSSFPPLMSPKTPIRPHELTHFDQVADRCDPLAQPEHPIPLRPAHQPIRLILRRPGHEIVRDERADVPSSATEGQRLSRWASADRRSPPRPHTRVLDSPSNRSRERSSSSWWPCVPTRPGDAPTPSQATCARTARRPPCGRRRGDGDARPAGPLASNSLGANRSGS